MVRSGDAAGLPTSTRLGSTDAAPTAAPATAERERRSAPLPSDNDPGSHARRPRRVALARHAVGEPATRASPTAGTARPGSARVRCRRRGAAVRRVGSAAFERLYRVFIGARAVLGTVLVATAAVYGVFGVVLDVAGAGASASSMRRWRSACGCCRGSAPRMRCSRWRSCAARAGWRRSASTSSASSRCYALSAESGLNSIAAVRAAGADGRRADAAAAGAGHRRRGDAGAARRRLAGGAGRRTADACCWRRPASPAAASSSSPCSPTSSPRGWRARS